MATGPITNPSQGTLSALTGTARTLVIALAWGAIKLIVFGLWMRSKYEGTARIVTTIFFIGGGATALLAAWQAFLLWFKKESPEQKAGTLAQQKTYLSYALIAGGLGLIVLAFVLGLAKLPTGYSFDRNNFAESFGVLLLGVVALGSGYGLQQPAGEGGITLQFLVEKIPVLKLTQIVICVGSLLLIVFLVYRDYTNRGYANWIPELALLLFLSILALACFLYLNSPNLDEAGVRLFVLMFGGGAGMLLFLWSLWRTFVWRDDILLGGSAAWQGPNAWRFWICAYVLFTSLVLMFFSFNLAKADVRSNVVLRRVMFGYDAVVQALLLLGILYIFNIVIYALIPYSFDWTKTRGAYAISEKTKNIIGGLKQETNIVVLVNQNSIYYKDLRILLENCQALNAHLKVTNISPEADDDKYESLVKNFPKVLPESGNPADRRGILIVFGPMPDKPDHKTPNSFVSESKLHTMDPPTQRGQKPKSVFKGEAELMREIQFLTAGKKQQKVYILQGNGEVDLSVMDDAIERTDNREDYSRVGIGLLVDQLKKDNYEVSGLHFGVKIEDVPNMVYAKPEGAEKRKEVPADCQALIVAGLTSDLPKETLDAIENYLDRGGKMLAFVDFTTEKDYSKLKQTNFETMLTRFGVKFGDDLAVRFHRGFGQPNTIYASTPKNASNPLARGFTSNVIFMKRFARIVDKADAPGRFKAEVILEQAFVDNPPKKTLLVKDVKVLADFQRFIKTTYDDEQKLLALLAHRKSVPFGVAVTEGEKPRMVVFGDTDFITNREIAESATRAMNYSFVASALEWLAERPNVGIGPREATTYQMNPEANTTRMIALPGWIMLIGTVALGVCIWVVRRR